MVTTAKLLQLKFKKSKEKQYQDLNSKKAWLFVPDL